MYENIIFVIINFSLRTNNDKNKNVTPLLKNIILSFNKSKEPTIRNILFHIFKSLAKNIVIYLSLVYTI